MPKRIYILVKASVPAFLFTVVGLLSTNTVFADSSPTFVKNTITNLKLGAKTLVAMPYDLLRSLSADKRAEAINAQLALRSIVEQSQVLLNDGMQTIPYKNLANKKMALVEIGTTLNNTFEFTTNLYAPLSKYTLATTPSKNDITKLVQETSSYNSFLISLNNVSLDSKAHSDLLATLKLLAQKGEVVVVNFGKIENLALLNDPKITLLQANNTEYESQNAAAQILFGGIPATGKLPAAVGAFPQNAGETTTPTRFKYTVPEEVGIDGAKLAQIDAIANQSIAGRVFPGCQIFVAKQGKVIYNKSFGWHEYNGSQPVQNSDMYDIASVTKCAATTLAVMKLIDEGKLTLDSKLGDFVPDQFNYVKFTTVREFLTHTSGLPATLPIGLFQRSFSNFRASDEKTGVKVAEGLYFKKEAVDSIYKLCYRTPIYSRGAFKYSDANFNFLGKIVELAAKERLDLYCNRLYKSLGLHHTSFNPLDNNFKTYQIAPTEQDNTFRYQMLRGYVHDESAALMGGVSGNAGLFSNAAELATIFQLFLNGGNYGGEQLLQQGTVNNFTNTTTASYRGYGFDKQSPKGAVGVGRLAPMVTFGHTGFTGTCAWADPQNQLVYVFLSNRVYPNRNNAINRLDIRERIHDVIYNAIK